jgi:3-oxoacyl-[acyl-carrier-protein] synthase-3
MAIIESSASCVSHHRLLPKGARRLADDALEECLARAELRPDDIDLLVNAGIYREKNLAEPALAAMIQEDIGANPGHPHGEQPHGTFSFDVAAGGCGVLTAFELIDGLIASRVIDVGVVVASDSDPGNTDFFPFSNAGGAALLRAGPAGAGFQFFESETFSEHAGAFESTIVWHEKRHPLPFGAPGKNVLEIQIREDFAALSLACAASSVRRCLTSRGILPEGIDLLVASTFPRDFPASLAKELGLSPGSVVAAEDGQGVVAHTAGIIASLDAAMQSGRFPRAKNVLFVTVGAGITVATALYRTPPGA